LSNIQGRITPKQALKLYDLDLFDLGLMANEQRVTRYGKKAYFNINRHINPTNICKDVCKFCAFSASRKNPNPYTMSHDEILRLSQEATKSGADEVHIVSAHNDQVGLDWYVDIFQKIKSKFPNLHIKALTAAEIHFLATEHNKTHEQIIDLMIQSGVDSMPGGGAEIFDEQVRNTICKGKVSSSEWLHIHKLWHQRGKMSNATMLFGHIESRENRIDHMKRLRDLQDITGGFNAFIPLVYQKENNYLKVEDFPTSTEILKTYAIARLFLDNIPHIKAYWVTSSINLALMALEFGADDLDGTIQKESINSAAGAKSGSGMELDAFVSLIRNAGFLPVQRDTLYNELKTF
jgi:aminodeoxyfutalosine synthase